MYHVLVGFYIKRCYNIMNETDKKKLFKIRCMSKSGTRLTEEEQKFCEKMYQKYPNEYTKMND